MIRRKLNEAYSLGLRVITWKKTLLKGRKRTVARYLAKAGTKGIQFGCSTTKSKHIKGFLNSDIIAGFYTNAAKKLPLPSEAFDIIFHEHMFEHVGYPKGVQTFCEEQYRILKKGGVLRFAMPDFEGWVKLHKEGKINTLTKMADKVKPIVEENYPMEVINKIFMDHGHKFIYDYETAKNMLKKAGFKSIKKMKYGKSRIKGWKHDKYPLIDTMYIEATK